MHSLIYFKSSVIYFHGHLTLSDFYIHYYYIFVSENFVVNGQIFTMLQCFYFFHANSCKGREKNVFFQSFEMFLHSTKKYLILISPF